MFYFSFEVSPSKVFKFAILLFSSNLWSFATFRYNIQKRWKLVSKGPSRLLSISGHVVSFAGDGFVVLVRRLIILGLLEVIAFRLSYSFIWLLSVIFCWMKLRGLHKSNLDGDVVQELSIEVNLVNSTFRMELEIIYKFYNRLYTQ